MYYIIGDIHGCIDKITSLYEKIKRKISTDDTIIFLGDYIDRGPDSFTVIEFLLSLAESHPTVFLKGNHESMFLQYVQGGGNEDIYFYNGGRRTINSYTRQFGSFHVPARHMDFYLGLKLYFEGDNFIAVHGGLNPKIDIIERQIDEEILWIRDTFFRAEKRWGKTVIFGHTPTIYFTPGRFQLYFDDRRNIIGIDTGAVFGGLLSCLRWPDKAVFQS